jgi:hypothetical protein
MATYDKPLTGYNRAQQPAIAGNEKQWMLRELQKLEAAIRELIAAIQELRAQNP